MIINWFWQSYVLFQTSHGLPIYHLKWYWLICNNSPWYDIQYSISNYSKSDKGDPHDPVMCCSIDTDIIKKIRSEDVSFLISVGVYQETFHSGTFIKSRLSEFWQALHVWGLHVLWGLWYPIVLALIPRDMAPSPWLQTGFVICQIQGGVAVNKWLLCSPVVEAKYRMIHSFVLITILNYGKGDVPMIFMKDTIIRENHL